MSGSSLAIWIVASRTHGETGVHVAVTAWLAPGALLGVLWAGAAYLALLYVAESAAGWHHWIAAQNEESAA